MSDDDIIEDAVRRLYDPLLTELCQVIAKDMDAHLYGIVMARIDAMAEEMGIASKELATILDQINENEKSG